MKASLIINVEEKKPFTVPLSENQEITLGRSRKCSVPLTDKKLSRRHCIISFDGSKYLIRDNQSTNGTFINGKEVTATIALSHNMVVNIGNTVLRFVVEGSVSQDIEPIPTDDPLSEEIAAIGPYQIISNIGKGGIGTVYKALHLDENRIVALKLLKPEAVEDQKAIARFIKEARACASLDHPNIVKTLDFGIYLGDPYLILEYIPSRSLAEWIPLKRLSLLDILHVGEQVADALICSHGLGIIHRDIKPGNILVSDKLEVKLIDMGLVKIIHESGLTMSGQAVGTPRYMSPEQIMDAKSVDERTDIYALGATLYHLIAGKPPYFEIAGKRITELLKQIYLTSPQPLEQLIDIPGVVSDLIQKSMDKNPLNRYRNANSFLRAIRKTQKKVKSMNL